MQTLSFIAGQICLEYKCYIRLDHDLFSSIFRFDLCFLAFVFSVSSQKIKNKHIFLAILIEPQISVYFLCEF